MILSMKTRYAMVALARLAKDYGKGPVHIKTISEEEKIPLSFLENILLELKKADILGSKRGKSGGYYLHKDPADVSLADIIRLYEGSIALLYCIAEDSYQPCEFCKDESICKIRKIFKEIMDTTNSILSVTTLSTLTK